VALACSRALVPVVGDAGRAAVASGRDVVPVVGDAGRAAVACGRDVVPVVGDVGAVALTFGGDLARVAGDVGAVAATVRAPEAGAALPLRAMVPGVGPVSMATTRAALAMMSRRAFNSVPCAGFSELHGEGPGDPLAVHDDAAHVANLRILASCDGHGATAVLTASRARLRICDVPFVQNIPFKADPAPGGQPSAFHLLLPGQMGRSRPRKDYRAT
jgi:hypothetical protein